MLVAMQEYLKGSCAGQVGSTKQQMTSLQGMSYQKIPDGHFANHLASVQHVMCPIHGYLQAPHLQVSVRTGDGLALQLPAWLLRHWPGGR